MLRLLPALVLLPLLPSQNQPWVRVAAVDVTRADGGGHARGTECYRYGTGEIPIADLPADAATRQVLFGRRVTLGFAGLRPGAHYQLRLQLLSDSDQRRIRITADDQVRADALELPRGRVLPQTVPLQASPQGTTTVVLRALAGPNVPLCGAEVWADDPTPLRPLPPLAEALAALPSPTVDLCPRPATVTAVAAPRLLLDGTWRLATTAPGDPGAVTAGQATAWPAIEVPGEWAMQGFAADLLRPVLYLRTFELPADWQGLPARLRFEAVHSIAEVWLNGHRMGRHEGSFVPFELDVGAALVAGTNTLAVAVTSQGLADTLASASQYAAHPLGGITRSVELFALPPLHLTALTVVADHDPATGVETVVADLALSARGGVRCRVRDPQGRELVVHEVLGLARPVQLRFPVPNARAWDPEHPVLHELTVEVLDGDRVTSTVVQRLGFRRIEVTGNRLLVNGRPIRLRGACRHEVHPTRGRSLAAATARADAELLRAANCNYVRTSHYPPSEAFLDACDELGLWVECEAALCWIDHGANASWADRDPEDPALFPFLLQANLENLAAHRHHPSVLLWSLAN